MGRLVDGLLQLARASEVERLNIVPVPVGPLLQSIASQLSRLGGRDWTVIGDDQLTAFADQDALRQIVLNLARNAYEHSPPDTGIELSAARRGQEVEITVADRGSGIDPKLHGHIFERFAHDGDGIGLGLAISKALAESAARLRDTRRSTRRRNDGHDHAARGTLTPTSVHPYWRASISRAYGLTDGATFTWAVPHGPWPVHVGVVTGCSSSSRSSSSFGQALPRPSRPPPSPPPRCTASTRSAT